MEMDKKKRAFVKKAVYVVPAIITVSAIPSLASAGSVRGNEGVGNGYDGPANYRTGNFNDAWPYTPGNPGGKNGHRPRNHQESRRLRKELRDR